MYESVIDIERTAYHRSLAQSGVLKIDKDGVASNADRSSRLSVAVAASIARQLHASHGAKHLGQTAGVKFEEITARFVANTFPQLSELRPGQWHVEQLGNFSRTKTSSFVQYEHLADLAQITKMNPQLSASLGNDYMVSPDIVVYRDPLPDERLNAPRVILSPGVATMADIRYEYNKLPILHASISAKWTMRSDRAQNSRTEALNLIRNRKGHLPHIVVVTGEPMPSRIASLALGTGDIDCVYHFALYELCSAVHELQFEDAEELLNILIDGKRLKDISDLPLDLAV